MNNVPPNGGMTSNRPYMIRAIYEWINDNGMTPYLLVDAATPGVRVPPSAIKEGKVVLNVAPRAVSQLDMGNDFIQFLARFGGVSQSLLIPVAAVQAIYAQETGQGMMLPPEEAVTEDEPDDSSDSAEMPGEETLPPEPPKKRGSHLRVIK